jgi:hypothetical protein
LFQLEKLSLCIIQFVKLPLKVQIVQRDTNFKYFYKRSQIKKSGTVPSSLCTNIPITTMYSILTLAFWSHIYEMRRIVELLKRLTAVANVASVLSSIPASSDTGKKVKYAVLRIRNIYPGSRILIFTHPGSRISDPGSRIQKHQ